jgi:ankyrin repeat protein
MNTTFINFANKYSDNSSEVKNFFTTLDKISTNFKLEKIDFLYSANTDGNTLLHLVILKNDLEFLELLLDLIKNVPQNLKSILLDSKNNEGNTPLHIAASFCEKAEPDTAQHTKCKTMAKLLDKAGASKNIPNRSGFIISSDEPNEKSEYSQNLLAASRKFIPNSLLGGISSLLSNMTTEISLDYKEDPKKNQKNINLRNITTDVSIENLSPLRGNFSKNNNNLNNLPTEVSVAEESPSLSKQSSPEQFVTEQSATEQSAPEKSATEQSVTEQSNSMISSEFESSDSSSSNKMRGGANSEKSTMSNTSSFVKSLLTQFNSMKGGVSRSTGQRRLPSLNDYDYNEMYGGRDFSLSREQMKESSSLHDEVVKIFMDNGKSEEEARIMKMALYKYTKDKHPELNNLDRAKKMREYADESSIINKLDLDTSRKIFEEVSKSKQKNSENSENSSKKNTEMNTSEIETTEEKPKKAKKASVKKASVKKASVKKAKK